VKLGYVRHDAKFPDAVRKQKPLLAISPDCPAAQDIRAIGDGLQRIRMNMADWLADRKVLQDIPPKKS
jgi:flagellar biosynthesis protein FlhG